MVCNYLKNLNIGVGDDLKVSYHYLPNDINMNSTSKKKKLISYFKNTSVDKETLTPISISILVISSVANITCTYSVIHYKGKNMQKSLILIFVR